MTCEDYPCCGHTPLDPCSAQWYDAPGAFDTSRPGNEHALCDHENGECEVDYYDDEEDNEPSAQDEECWDAREEWIREDAAMEYGLFGGDC